VSRDFPTNVASALAAQHVATVTFVKLEFSSGTLYLHNSIGTYTWGSQSWLGTGGLGNVSAIEEGSDVSPYKITLSLSGIDSTISNAALTEDYYMRPVTLYLGALDANDDLLATPTQVWAGFMDQMNVTLGADGGDAIELIAESELAKFDRASNQRYTDNNQQAVHSADLIFEFLQDIEGIKVLWGDRSSDSGAGKSIPTDNAEPERQTR
jgi:hypothetical protein